MPAKFQFIRKAGWFTATQMGVIGLNAVTGFFLVRSLPPREFAWFTIYNAMASTFAVILDPLAGSGLQSVIGDRTRNAGCFAAGLSSAFHARWRWILSISFFLVPWTLYLLYKAGAPTWTMGGLVGICVASVPAITGTTIWTVVPKLSGDNGVLQKVDALGAASRLCLSVALVSLQKVALCAGAATALAQTGQCWLARRRVTGVVLSTPDPVMVQQLHGLMHSMIAHTVFQCFQAQTGIWMLGLFGTQQSIANLGALSRLGILLAPLGALFQQLIIPSFARFDSQVQRQRLAHQMMIFLIFCCGVATGTCLLMPGAILWILGPAYQHLSAELPVAMALFSCTTVATIVWWFNSACGKTGLSRWVPPATILVFGIVGLVLRPVDTLGVLWFLLAGAAASLLLGLLQAVRSLAQPNFSNGAHPHHS